MKIKIISQVKRSIFIPFFLLSWIAGLYSQQFIKFKSGKSEKAVIVHQTKDTLEYHLLSESEVTRIVPIDQVDTIINLAWDTTLNLSKDRTYLHYKHRRNVGIVLASFGTPITIGGIIVISSAHHTDPNSFWGDTYHGDIIAGAIVTGIGGALLVTGTVLVITHSAKMKKYKNKLRGFSFNLKYASELKGISLLYRF